MLLNQPTSRLVRYKQKQNYESSSEEKHSGDENEDDQHSRFYEGYKRRSEMNPDRRGRRIIKEVRKTMEEEDAQADKEYRARETTENLEDEEKATEIIA